jgi:hypothetical protein
MTTTSASGHVLVVQARLRPELVKAIDEERRARPDLPSRNAVINELLARALGHRAEQRGA